MEISRRTLLKAGLGASASGVLLAQGVQQALALLEQTTLDPLTPLGSDYSVFRSVNKLTAHPHNYQVHEVPNCVVVDPFAFSGKGMACAVHGFSVHRGGLMAPDLLGAPPGLGERPLLGRAHYVVMELPNPAWKSPTNPINGRWLHWEGLVDLFEVAFSPAQTKEIWYLGVRRGQHDIGNNIQLGFLRLGNEVRLSASGNWKWRSRITYGVGNTPYRPGDEDVPSISLSPKVPAGTSFLVDNALYFTDIPRDTGGRTHGMETTAWLRHDDAAYPAGCPTPPPDSNPAPLCSPSPPPEFNITPLFPRMPAGADFDPDPSVLAQLSATARTAYLTLNS
jgi:hypothetical protein